ncbi:MAG TPA: MurR/RpiR family transcriptional regulator [Allosphingosinicella sp.]|jgi:DNA-binding MurR/RpiR family transcriptional regulator
MTRHSAPVVSLIGDRYAELSETHRKVADFILSNPHRAALMTLDDFARETGASQATTNRLGRKLGLSGFQELKRLLRAELQEALSPDEDLVATVRAQHLARKAPWTESIDEDIERLSRVRAVGGDATFLRASTLLASARRVWMIGFGSSAYVAQYGAFSLSTLRDGCEALPDNGGIESAERRLLGAGPEDAALLIAFARYSQEGIRLARRLHGAGVPLILVSDVEEAPHVAFTSHHFLVGRKSGFVLSGCGPAGLAVVEALVRAAAAAIGPEAAEQRSARLTASLSEVVVRS